MATSYSPQLVTNGLVFLLDSANPKSYPGSGTNIVSLAGNPNLTGSLTNGPTFTVTSSGAIRFDGTNDHILVSSASSDAAVLQPTSEITVGIFALIESKSYATGFFDFVRKSNANADGYVFRFASSTTNAGPLWTVRSGGTAYATQYGANGSLQYTQFFGQWTYFVGTYSDPSNNQFLYINAERVASRTAASPAMQHTGNMSIMGNVVDADYLKGLFGQVHIYNRALSQQEILQNYNALRARFGV